MKGCYTVEEIGKLLERGKFPVYGETALGSASFVIREPAGCIAVALHNGSRVRPEVEAILEVGRNERFREEDPYTAELIAGFPIQLIARDSRFEYDLNWEAGKCIYPWEEKKWGMQVWNSPPSDAIISATLEKYSEFHDLLDLLVNFALNTEQPVLLYDVHAYCYRRDEERTWWEDNRPDINLGTRSINRDYFGPMIDAFLRCISDLTIDGHTLRIGENTLFPGGHLTRKFTGLYPEKVLVLAIEFKKLFMDEWTGQLFPEHTKQLAERLLLTSDALRKVQL